MRHGKRRSKLSMMTSHRNATMRNMVRHLFKYQRIQTTVARAKEARRLAERLITMAKRDTVASRRLAYMILNDRDMIAKLFKEIGPLFKERNSGYTRVIPLGFRRGDGANMAFLELTEKKIVEKLPKKKKEKSKAEEAKSEAAKEAKKSVAEEKKEEPRIKPMSKAKPTLEEEKRAEKVKAEDKRMTDKKGFMKNLRGFFRRKTDM